MMRCLTWTTGVVAVFLVPAAAHTKTTTAPVLESLVALDGDVPWVVPPELSRPSEGMSDAANDTAQTLALRDVELDWYKVTGYRAIIYSNASWDPTARLNNSQPVIFFGDASRHSWLETTFNVSSRGCGLERGSETHCIVTVDGFMWNGAFIRATAVVVVGNGTRGSVFAAYTFSQTILGVAPFHRFTFAQPAWQAVVQAAGPGSVSTWGPPRFTHRCVFLNDEELLGFFRRDPLGEQIFDPSTVDDILQSLLRAKGNCIIMGTTPYPDERSLRLAARRGVVLTASHFEIVGFNAFAWSRAFGRDSTTLWDWTKHPDLMAHTFAATINAQKDYEMIWSVGLRGLNDYAYPNCRQNDPGPMGCGEIISQAIGNQTALLSEITGKSIADLDFKFNLWTEALGMYQRGELRLPPHTRLVMSDSGSGFIDGDAETFAHADGVYYHVQMLNGNGGQLTEFVPPSRIFEQMSSYCRQARSTSIFVLNLSDLKPAILTAAAALSFAWDSAPYEVNSTIPGVPNRTADESQQLFLREWAAEQFPHAEPKTLSAIQQLWSNYFLLPWIVRGASDEALAGAVGGLADSLAGDLARNFSVSAATAKTAQRTNLSFVPGLTNVTQLHQAAQSMLPQIPTLQQQFFKSHLLVQVSMHRYSVEAISALVNATFLLASSPVPTPGSVILATVEVDKALGAFDALFQAQREAEGAGDWRGMYWADRHRFTNFQARRRELLRLRAALDRSVYNPDSQIDCCQMEYSYQWTPAHLASYPLIYDRPDQRARDFVLISCTNATADGGTCQNNRGGGTFIKSATVELSLIASLEQPGDAIHYSLDGSVPSLVYSSPITLTKTTVIRAVKVPADGAADVMLSRNVTYFVTE